MTTAKKKQKARADIQKDLEAALEAVKAAGGRITKIRRALLAQVSAAAEPVSAAAILDALEKEGLTADRTTVYRELAFLTSGGFLREVRLIGAPSLYESAAEHRHHLICRNCHRVRTIVMDNHLETEEQEIMAKEDFEVTGHSLEFYGLCARCREDGRKSADR